MTNPASQVRPALTRREIIALRETIHRARNELIEMVKVNGPLLAMWAQPRKYFTPETDKATRRCANFDAS